MKKRLYIMAIAALLSCSLTSCEGFLEENPKSSISPGQFYKSNAEANAGAIGCYSDLIKNFGGTGSVQWDMNYWLHYGTDIARPTGGREAQYSFHIYTLSVATEGCAPDMWRVFYRGVTDACNLIDQVSASAGVSENVRDQIVAEGKMYRAFYYYYLTTQWGDVPFIDKFDTNYAISGLPRTPVSDIRKKMIQDLEETASYLPENSDNDYKGRPTRWAANMLLCKYYLWEKEWTKASALCEDIITKSSHSLLTNYDDLWGLANEYNKESIWEFDYVQHINLSNRTTQMCPRGMDEISTDPDLQKAFTGFGLVTATDEMIGSFTPGDKRRIWYRWLEGDPRVNFKFNYVAKFLDKPGDMIRGNSGINVLFYRLADAYLMQAEAENELNNGPSPKAYERINVIRARAGLPALSGRSKDQFFSDIMNERKWELGFEYHRKTDLCRWNKLAEVVKTMGKTNPEGAKYVQSYHQLLPIPSKELMKNPNLKQNPGYE